jgi:UPF0755 protein
VGVGYLWWQQQLAPVNPLDTSQKTLIIPKSQAASQVVDQLLDKNLIKSALTAKVYLKISGLDKNIQNGTFLLSSSQTTPQILTALTRAPKDVWVTVPEGWRREQIAERLEATLISSGSAEFNKAQFIDMTKLLEGQLFPDTYLIPRTATAADVIKTMTNNFTQKTKLDLTTGDRNTLVLASLVEREGKTDADRPIIAAILQKRLKAGWPLQVDATVQYAQDSVAGPWWKTPIDTKLPSAYNTYLHLGLPPTPICNPGLSAIQAATNPPQTPYWYYLHSSDGQVHFGRDLSEHNANIDKYLNH